MGWRWHNGWWRSEGEITKIENEKAAGCFVAVVIVACLVWSGVNNFLEWAGLKEPTPDEPATEEVVAPSEANTSYGVAEVAIETNPQSETPNIADGTPLRTPAPPAPPTPKMAQIAQLINTTPQEGTAALFKTYHGVWQTTEPIFIAGELEQREAAGLLFRVLIPEHAQDKVLSRYTVDGVEKWSPWMESKLDVATGLFGGSEHYYATLRLSAVQDVVFTAEESIMFSMVTKPGQKAQMVPMRREGLSEAELPETPSESNAAIREALAVFKDGTLDEAKVAVTRLNDAATRFPDDPVIPQLRDHVLAVFRADHALGGLENKMATSDQLVAQRLNEVRALARQGGGGLDAAQLALEEAQQQSGRLQLEVDSTKQRLTEALDRAAEFCREAGGKVDLFASTLLTLRARSE